MTNVNEEESKPVVAILTMPGGRIHFRGNQANFQDIVRTGQEMGFPVYVVTIKDLKLSGETIKGYTLNEKKEWEQRLFPLPQVIYNRIPQREDELRPAVRRKIKECLVHPAIRFYNPYFFNKWHLFEWLKKSKSTAHFVPKTKRLRGEAGLQKMLERYPCLYLKPESGKAGKGIMMLKYQKDKLLPYRLKVQNHKGSTTYKGANIQRLWARIRMETGASPYIIQQGIELTAVDNRPFDLRVLLQKTERGQWGVTGVGARMAGTKSITTHVPRGGSIEDPKEMLAIVFGAEFAPGIMNRVRNTSIIIAKQIEKASGYTHGEMSMDLGMDASGNIWFFEANAKPMKFDEPHIRQKSLERIFHYCKHLASH
ncbi:YheC/YheD family protein [Paenibacillus chibensis]|uniref:YheC/YheD family endospore coat-associated protein n=1 Tax=Paenibacillus chibensis TaxID=59846 RepID=UPI001FE8E999|nr:YheC/YheD family protein [Paenibacillus chibensis]MEC0368881.1 YheC/YheD family protein [Paenibacillus chibensis]